MLSTASRLRIQAILKRLAKGEKVSLKERIYINKYASRDQNVSAWLRKASRLQQNKPCSNHVDELLHNLDLHSSDPHATYNKEIDDLGEWFSGAPSWLRRS